MKDEPDPVTYPSGFPKPIFEAPATPPEVMILTGMSGAGRTHAAGVLGDLGWYVVDNLPPQLLGGLVAMVGREPHDRLAAVVDVRGGEFFQDLDAVVDDLADRSIPVRLVFLDASDQVLVRRFEEARRPHPLQRDGTLLEGIARERHLLSALRDRADLTIDTSDLNVHELRETITAEVGLHDQQLTVNVVS
ncbi:MAG: RNase adaptor protein RapZ, partial [Demequinaceae bacterium]|nr:RNase adaptor protein RapZ [Demequinaceae bacterium]